MMLPARKRSPGRIGLRRVEVRLPGGARPGPLPGQADGERHAGERRSRGTCTARSRIACSRGPTGRGALRGLRAGGAGRSWPAATASADGGEARGGRPAPSSCVRSGGGWCGHGRSLRAPPAPVVARASCPASAGRRTPVSDRR